MSKVLAIESGCDWELADVDYVVLNLDVDIDDLELDYRRAKSTFSFAEWLVRQGHARWATEEKDFYRIKL